MRTLDPDDSVWLITGCSSGFGRELARALLARGRQVVVTARKLAALEEFSAHEEALVVALDITRPEQIAECLRLAEARFGRVDVLVNNAGYGYLAAIEEGEEAEIRALFDTNVFGLAAMTRAVLPGMRQRRRGHIVNISSMGGLVGFAGVGYYNATKFAVEGLTEALVKEVTPLGISVTAVEPGPFRTEWAGARLRAPAQGIADYAETAGARRTATQGYNGKQPGDPARAADAIIRAVESSEPPLHLVLGRPAYDNVTNKLAALGEELERWRALALSADFPEGE